MIVITPNPFFFHKAMDQTNMLSDKAHDYLMEIPNERWSRNAFDLKTKSPISPTMCLKASTNGSYS